MPATDNSAVQIAINVVDGATGETISRVTKSLDSLGEAGARNGQKLKQGLSEAGHAGEAVGPAVGKGMKEAGAHSLSALDNVRLLRDDLGIRIPRAMEMVIAKSALLSGAIGAIGTGLVALGAIEIFVRLGEEAYKFYKKVTDVNVEMRKFAEEAGKNANAKLFDTSSIEEVNALLQQTDASLASIEKKRRDAGVGNDNKGSLVQFLDKYLPPDPTSQMGQAYKDAGINSGPGRTIYTAADDRERARKAANDNLLRESKEAINARRELGLQEAKAAEDGMRLTGRAATAAAERNAIILAQLKQTQQLKQAVFQRDSITASNALIKSQNPKADEAGLRKAGYQDVPVVAPDLGAQDAADAIARAQSEAGAKNSKQTEEEMIRARHATAEAAMAGYEGEALSLAKEQEKIRQLMEEANRVRMDKRALAMLLQASREEAYQAQTKRMRDEDARAAEMEAGANVGGKTGLAKLDAERDAKLKKFENEAAAGKYTNVDTLGRYTAATNQEHDAEAQKAQESFTERLTSLDAGRSDRYASESDRITQSAQRTVREISKAWDDLYGKLDAGDARRVQGQQALNAEIARTNADAARQRQEAGQRVEDETHKLEDQARRQGLPKYQQETAAIVDDYNERIQKLEELRAKDAANADRYRRQELAEEQIKNGKLLEQQRALRDQLAGKLQGFFSNPLEALKREGEQSAAKYAAEALLKFSPRTSAAIVNAGKGGDGAFGLPSIFGSGFGGKHPATFDHGASQAGSGTHNDNPLAATTRDLGLAATTNLTASTAIIHVGSATIAGGAVAGRGAYAPIGKGGFFNTGKAGAGSSLGSITADAGSAAGTTSGITDEAGASASLGGQIESGVSTAGSAASSIKDIGSSAGIFGKAGDSDDAGAASEAGAADAGSGAGAAASGGGGAGGAISGGIGLFSAIEGKGGFGGALSGAVAGAQLGASLGGPIGAAIGAAGGAILGFIGFGARSKAAEYDRKTVKPRLANDLRSYEAGQSDYQTVYDGFSTLTLEAKQQTKQFGPGASGYYDDTIVPEINAAQQRLTREQKAGRSQFGMTAAQYHQGGIMRDFGSMATSPTEGWFHGIKGEAVLNQQAAMRHADAAMLMNSGASRSQMAEYYGGGSSSGTRVAQSSGGGDVHFNVSAVDARGVQQFFDEHGHKIRAALNKSYAENSGGGDYA